MERDREYRDLLKKPKEAYHKARHLPRKANNTLMYERILPCVFLVLPKKEKRRPSVPTEKFLYLYSPGPG